MNWNQRMASGAAALTGWHLVTGSWGNLLWALALWGLFYCLDIRAPRAKRGKEKVK